MNYVFVLVVLFSTGTSVIVPGTFRFKEDCMEAAKNVETELRSQDKAKKELYAEGNFESVGGYCVPIDIHKTIYQTRGRG